MPLLTGDHEKILELIDLIYSIADRSTMLQSFFERLRKIIPFSSAVLIPFDPQTGQLQIQLHFLLNTSVRELTLYLDHYAPLDPFALTDWTKKNLNKAACFTDVVSRSYLVDSEYGCDFLPRVPFFHGMGIMMASQGDSIGVLGLHRQKEDRNFTPREKEIMNRLTPHLSKALYYLSLMEGNTISEEIGVVVVGLDGQPMYLNEDATRVLNGRFPEFLANIGLSTKPSFFQAKGIAYWLRNIPLQWKDQRQRSAEIASKTLIPINLKEEERSRSLRRRMAQIILLQPLPKRWDLQAKLGCWGLTPRQEEIVLWVVRGLSNREIAERLFIIEQTVKDHLHDIFEKVEVRRRSELIAKVLGI